MKRRKAIPKNELRNKSLLQKLRMSARVLASIGKVLDFPFTELVKHLKIVRTDLRKSANRVAVLEAQLRSERNRKKQLEKEFNRAYGSLTNGVNQYAGGDASKIAACGLNHWLPGYNPSKGAPPAPTHLRASLAEELAVVLTWRMKLRVNCFVVYITQTPDDPESWTVATLIVKTKAKITGLKSQERYWFRVTASRGNVESPPSSLKAVVIQ